MKLSEHRWVSAIWCDDIRQEVGNKPSFMGVYTGALVLPILPAVLQRLAVWVDICTPKSQPFKSLKLRVCKNDIEGPLAEIVLSPEELASAADQMKSVDENGGVDAPDAPTALKIALVILLGQLQLNESSKWFKVWVDTEAEVLESFKLPILTSNENQPLMTAAELAKP